jgi:peptide/nickel transport system substrate-binding protein
VHTPTTATLNDEKIAQTVAQMFSRISINKVEGAPMSVYSAA